MSLHGSLTVRLLDFSESGVLIASKTELGHGECALLSAVTPSNAAVLPVEIGHVSLRVLPDVGPRYCAGATFVNPSPEQRAQLDAMLRMEHD